MLRAAEGLAYSVQMERVLEGHTVSIKFTRQWRVTHRSSEGEARNRELDHLVTRKGKHRSRRKNILGLFRATHQAQHHRHIRRNEGLVVHVKPSIGEIEVDVELDVHVGGTPNWFARGRSSLKRAKGGLVEGDAVLHRGRPGFGIGRASVAKDGGVDPAIERLGETVLANVGKSADPVVSNRLRSFEDERVSLAYESQRHMLARSGA